MLVSSEIAFMNSDELKSGKKYCFLKTSQNLVSLVLFFCDKWTCQNIVVLFSLFKEIEVKSWK